MSANGAGRAFLEPDHVGGALGMTLVSDGPDVEVRMPVRADMVNGGGTCHGALLGALADATFAVAVNRGAARHVTVGYSLDFIAPARLGDVLVAQARAVAEAGRSGVTDVHVTAERDGTSRVVAEFRGRSRAVA